ncbi:MAG TPA: serine/threonine-protein kinase [Polyangiaceae bacterium]|nr:serine/threonine-protein kinase [Polyangiaceae bacterium]
MPPDRVVAVGFAERSSAVPQLEEPSGRELSASDAAMADAAIAEAAVDSPRERSIHPPGPLSDRYLGCTIDNRYKVEGIVGEGGMGVVYQCRHKIIDKRVALKILRADLAKDSEVTERFLMEAKAASAIQDEHIISISDFGQLPDGAAYFVMEFLDGTPLAQVTGGGTPMPLERILPIARQLSEGLGAAHQRGIVHRDLKPDNVFLIQRGKEVDFVKILDFGIAKVSSTGGGRLTQAGSVFGTPHYMSPEQAAGTPLDQRGDIYSLGVMLYELATGRVPFDAENFVGILSRHLYEDPIAPRAAAPEAHIPVDFEAIILKCMAKKPEQRYQSMLQLRDDLWQLERRRGPKPAEPSSVSPLEPAASVEGTALSTELSLASLRPRRWPLFAAIAAPLAIVSGVLAFELGHLGGRAAPAAPVAATGVAPVSPTPAAGPLPAAREMTPPAAEVPSEPQPVHVLLGVAPPTAHVFLDGTDLGASPVLIDVPVRSLVTVEVRHPDYATKRMQLDGSEVRVNVELDSKNKKRKKGSKSKRTASDTSSAAKSAPASRAPAARVRADEPIGSQLFVEPWQKP